jgi:hypothetical protein
MVAAVQLVLEAEVGEADRGRRSTGRSCSRRPAFDFAGVAIRAVHRCPAGRDSFLEPLLVLALELSLRARRAGISAPWSRSRFLFAQVGAIQLTSCDNSRGAGSRRRRRPAPASRRGRGGGLPGGGGRLWRASGRARGRRADTDRTNPSCSQVTEVRLPRISRLVARIAQIAFGHHPKRADCRKRPAVVAVELVPVIAVHDDLRSSPRGSSRPSRKTSRGSRSRSRGSRARSRISSRSRQSSWPRSNPARCPNSIQGISMSRTSSSRFAWVEVGHGSSYLWAHKDAFVEALSNYRNPSIPRQSAIGWRRAV